MYLYLWLYMLNLTLINIVLAGDIGDFCVPNNDIAEGICAVITDCDVAVEAVKHHRHHKYNRCGFSGINEIICCPQRNRNKPGEERVGDNSKPNKIENEGRLQRTADRECQKIIASSIPPLGLHIIGGETASLGEFPHMVALGFLRGNDYKFDCGGSLVSKTYVLTAAHCVQTKDNVVPSIARLGITELGETRFNEETDIRIADIISHPEYTRSQKYHDLALLRLETPAEFSSNLNAACLYTSPEDPTIPLTITGWGISSTQRDIKSTILLKANVTVVDRSKCSPMYSNWKKLPNGVSSEQLCAGDPNGAKDACQGDSGGPLQGLTSRDGHYRLIGITSFGRGCGSTVPGVYTRVSHYVDWIESIVWPN